MPLTFPTDPQRQQNIAGQEGHLLSTTDATQTVAFELETQLNTAYFIDLKVLATETTDFDETATYWRQACYRNDGGTVTLVGSIRTVVTDNETTGGWDVTFDISGTKVRALVTGAAATNVRWLVFADVRKLTYP